MEDVPDGPVKILGDDGLLGFVSEKEVGRVLEPPDLALVGPCSQKILEKGESGGAMLVIVAEFVIELDAHQAEVSEHVPDEFVLFLFDP
jgi:hypothetical protein